MEYDDVKECWDLVKHKADFKYGVWRSYKPDDCIVSPEYTDYALPDVIPVYTFYIEWYNTEYGRAYRITCDGHEVEIGFL